MKRLLVVILGVSVLMASPSMAEDLLKVDTKCGPIFYKNEKEIRTYGHTIRKGFWNMFNPKYPSIEKTVELHEELCDRVAELVGLKSFPGQTSTYFAEDQKDLIQRYKSNNGKKKNVIGFYSPSKKEIWYSPSHLGRKLVRHEMAHAALSQYFYRPVPMEMTEAVAEHIEWID